MIDEIRDIRRDLSERHGNDVRRLAEHLREIQRDWKGPIRRTPASRKRDAG